MVATHIEKIKHSMLCVTAMFVCKGQYKHIFTGLAFECDSSEHLLFLFVDRIILCFASLTLGSFA